MRYLNRILLLLVLAFMVSCAGEDEPSETYLIGFSQCTMGDDWRKTMIEEMMRELSLTRDPRMNLIVKDAEDSNVKQIRDINELIQQGIDLLIVSPNESEPLTPAIEKVYDSGIPVINIDRKINSEKFSAFIGADNLMIGRQAGIAAAELLKGRGKILEITGLQGSSAAIERSAGFQEILDQYPDIVIDHFEGEWLHEVARELSDSILSRSRDYDLIFAHNDPMAYGTYLSAEKNNLHPYILGVDGLYFENGGLDMVLNGILDYTFLYPTGGDQAIRLAQQILTRQNFNKYNYLSTIPIDENMARTMKLQGERIHDQQTQIDRQLEYVGELGFLLKRKNNILLLNIFISVLLVIVIGLIIYLLVQKNRVFLAVNSRNKMINEQYDQLSDQRDELTKLLKIAEEANEQKLRFFTNISHEFRSLISLITLPLGRLLDSEVSGEVREKLVIMNKNADRLSKLAQEILKFRKIDFNKYQVNLQKANIVAFLSEISETFRPKAQEKGILLTTDFPSKLMVEFDSSFIEKVMFNLLSNAIKYTEKGGIIYIGLEEEEKFLKIRVKDSGMGIPENELPYIFDRFYRGKYGMINGEENGMGIGLALCKELLSLHGGSLRVKSKEGKGSSFTALIPRSYDRFDVKKVPEATSHKENQTESKSEPLKINTFDKVKKILIVEDNSELRSIIAELLSKYYTVEEAVDGLDGFRKAIDSLPDLILSDILMPCMDGIQMTQDLKKHPSTYHIPVILLTAIASQESTIKGFSTGADDYIVKPFNENLLIRRIENLIESRSRIRSKYGESLLSVKEFHIEDHSAKVFFNSLVKKIYDNASSESYSLNQLAEDMNMSRSSLYRKIKELTGMKAIDFMKKIKLQYAAKLLISHDLTINEIAWRSGFSDAKYFSKCFQKEYGQIPSKFKTRAQVVH